MRHPLVERSSNWGSEGFNAEETEPTPLQDVSPSIFRESCRRVPLCPIRSSWNQGVFYVCSPRIGSAG